MITLSDSGLLRCFKLNPKYYLPPILMMGSKTSLTIYKLGETYVINIVISYLWNAVESRVSYTQ